MDRIKQMMDSLPELSDEQVTELQSEIVNEFETVEKEEPTPQTVDAMTSLADMLDTVRTEVKRREASAVELVQVAAEAAARVHGSTEGEAEAEAAAHGDMTDEIVEDGCPLHTFGGGPRPRVLREEGGRARRSRP